MRINALLAAAALLIALVLPVQAQEPCVGDCNDDGVVTVDELITGVNIALGTASLDTCPVFDENDDGQVTVNELITAVNNALEGCPPPAAGLGERVFSNCTQATPFAPPGRSAFSSSALSGSNVASGFGAGPLLLQAGEPDQDGVASLVLAEDAIIGVAILDGSAACYKFLSAGSTGTIDCDGGPAPNVVATQASGQEATETTITIEPGAETGPGAAVIQLMLATAQVPAPATVDDCLSASYGEPFEAALTTATATATKGTKSLSLDGENFSCDTWTTEDGPGMLAMPQPAYNVQAGGDSANILRLADTCAAP